MVSGHSESVRKRSSLDSSSHLLPGSKMDTRDVTLDIPLTAVPSRSQTGARSPNAISPSTYVPPTELPPTEESTAIEEHHPFAGRRRHLPMEDGKQLHSPRDGTLTKMGEFYMKILHFSVVTRYFIYVLPLAVLIAIPIIIGATVAQGAEIGGVRIVWFFTWVEVVWVSLWVSKIVAHYVPFVFQFLCGIVSSGTRKYALVLRRLEIPLSLVGWSVTCLATFMPIMTRNPANRERGDTGIKKWEEVVNNILFAIFVSTLILAAEKFFVQLISISYHRTSFELKIQESKYNIRMLSMLYGASRKMFPEYCKEFEAEDYVINDSIIGIRKKGHNRTGSTSPMRLIQNVGRVGDKITAAFGNVAQEITGKQVFNSNSAHSVVIMALEKQKSSEALARRLWMSFVLQGRDALYLEDLKDVLGPGNEERAEEYFAALDVDGNGDISLDEMILRVTEFGRQRDSISKSMHDVDQAIHILDNLLCFVVLIIVILVFVAFLNKGFGTTLAAGATALLSLSFVFATSAQEVLGSCIFLFVKHPYDVGDRVDINDRSLIVERISLLYTVFRDVADQRTIQVPNIVLNSNWIDNITRSKAMREQITLTVDFGTSFGDIQLLKNEMEKFVRDNGRDFQPDIDIEVVGVGEMSKLELRIEIRHKSNWSNESIRATRRSKFMCALVAAVRRVPIYGPGGGDAGLGSMSNPSYSVTISDQQAQENRDKFAVDKESKRMVPTSEMDSILSPIEQPENQPKTTGFQPAEAEAGSGLHYRGGAATAPGGGPSTAPSSEAAYIQNLNTRPAGMDQGRVDESDVLRIHDPSNTLTRGPSTGRRRAEQAPVPQAVTLNTLLEEEPLSQAPRQPIEYHLTSDSGHQSPYSSNNAYPQHP
ncbi:hypothetical protein VTO42DRAFT_8511 [Malbranchea cinnamomea]